MATSVQITFDCADPARLGAFWAAALGYKEQDPPEGFATWQAFLEQMGIPREQWNMAYAIVDPAGAGPRLYFQQVPEPKTVKNRVHLDVNAGGASGTPMEERRQRVAAEVERLGALGAKQLRSFDKRGEHWIVMQDPEGNEFCLQ